MLPTRIIEDGSLHEYEEFTPDTRPQYPHGDWTGLTFTTLEHGGDEPDNMPQAILLTDAQGRTCAYLPAKVVNSKGFTMLPGRD